MNKQNNKVSAEFLRSLKNTNEMPLKVNKTKSKDNQSYSMTKHESSSKKHATVVEDDFRKIAQMYVVEGEVLKKYEMNARDNLIPNQMPTNTKKQYYESSQEMMTLKEKVKLEYLQKKGFLTPQEQASLKKYRESQNASSHNLSKIPSNNPQIKTPELNSVYQHPHQQHSSHLRPHYDDYPYNHQESSSGYYPPNKQNGPNKHMMEEYAQKSSMEEYPQRYNKQYLNNNVNFKYY